MSACRYCDRPHDREACPGCGASRAQGPPWRESWGLDCHAPAHHGRIHAIYDSFKLEPRSSTPEDLERVLADVVYPRKASAP